MRLETGIGPEHGPRATARSRTARVWTAGSLAACLLAALFSTAARGQCQVDKLLGSDSDGSDWFGYAADMDGTTAVVGARYASNANGVEAGTVYVFEDGGEGQQEVARLIASDGGSGNRLGTAVAVDGATIVAGAPTHDRPLGNAGAAYVFERIRGVWVETVKLSADDAGEGDQLGDDQAVAVDGNTIVVGAFRHDGAATASGAAYVFERSGETWLQTRKLEADDAAQTDWFGTSVAVSGDTVVVGARRHDHEGIDDSGAAYVFERRDGDWAQVGKLAADDPAEDDEFGISVAIEGDRIVVGAQYDDGLGGEAGAAHVFERTPQGWARVTTLRASDGAAGDLFGLGIDLDGNRIAVGAWFDDDLGSASGSAYLFERGDGGWAETAKILAEDGGPNDKFGRAVALGTEQLLVTAYWDDDAGGNAGAAHVFTLAQAPDCNGNGQPDTCDVRAGASPDCDGNGMPDECDLAAGVFDDCDVNGVPDLCEVLPRYVLDDGSAEVNLWSSEGTELVWLNGFQVAPGGEVVTAIANTWWGGVADGLPVTYMLYDDPDDDGHPDDAVLLLQVASETRDTGPEGSDLVLVPPTYVGDAGDRFFVGAWATQDPYVAEAADTSSPARGESWITIADPGEVDLEVLTNNTRLPLAPLQSVCTICNGEGNWMLRALTAAVGACVCPEDTDGNGAVDADDLVHVILDFGKDGAGHGGDVNGDGVVDADDLVAVILAWGPCR